MTVTLDGAAPYNANLVRQASSGSLIGAGASFTSGAGGQFQTAGGTGDWSSIPTDLGSSI